MNLKQRTIEESTNNFLEKEFEKEFKKKLNIFYEDFTDNDMVTDYNMMLDIDFLGKHCLPRKSQPVNNDNLESKNDFECPNCKNKFKNGNALGGHLKYCNIKFKIKGKQYKIKKKKIGKKKRKFKELD